MLLILAFSFLLFTVLAGILGWGGLAGPTIATLSQTIFFILLALFVITVLAAFIRQSYLRSD